MVFWTLFQSLQVSKTDNREKLLEPLSTAGVLGWEAPTTCLKGQD